MVFGWALSLLPPSYTLHPYILYSPASMSTRGCFSALRALRVAPFRRQNAVYRRVSSASVAGGPNRQGESGNRSLGWSRPAIMRAVTLVEVTYELQSPLKPEQLRALGEFANTYGLRRFRLDKDKKQISFEYDASRLKETEVAHVLRQARIPVLRQVDSYAAAS